MDPTNLKNIPGHIEIDGLTMAKFFAEHMSTDLTIKTKAGKIAAIWIPDGQEAQEPEIMDQDREPDTTDPAPKNKVNSEAAQHLARMDNRRIEKALDALDQRLGQQLGPYPVTDQSQEDIIQILDDHIAVSPNPAQASSEKETDSGLEEPVTCEREEKESDNEFENQEKDVVATSTSDQEEIIIDPITIETYSEEGVQTLARKMGDKDEKEVQGLQEEEASNEYNSNQEEEKVMLELPTNRLQSPHQPSQQLLLHKVPIRFPVPSNLMESIETLIFINDALIILVGNLPSDALIDATPLNRVDSHQARTAVVLTFDTEKTRNRVLRAIRERRANTAIPREANSLRCRDNHEHAAKPTLKMNSKQCGMKLWSHGKRGQRARQRKALRTSQKLSP